MGDGHTIFGLKMASKVFISICGGELGKPYMLTESQGRDLVRVTDGIEGRGIDKKRRQLVMCCIGVQNLPEPERVLTYRAVFHCMHGGRM